MQTLWLYDVRLVKTRGARVTDGHDADSSQVLARLSQVDRDMLLFTILWKIVLRHHPVTACEYLLDDVTMLC